MTCNEGLAHEGFESDHVFGRCPRCVTGYMHFLEKVPWRTQWRCHTMQPHSLAYRLPYCLTTTCVSSVEDAAKSLQTLGL